LIDNNISFNSIKNLSNLLQNKEISPVELLAIYLEKIEKLNPLLSAYITVCAEEAKKHAVIAEQEILKGKYKGFLHGIPIALKDNIFTSHIPTSAASPGLKNNITKYSATAWNKLSDSGAILIGKTMLHEYAIAASLWSEGYGAARNPWNHLKTTNGSSSGSAAAVASGMCVAALGTETGASVRRPASFCGIVSMLGTYGRISRHGIIPNSWSLDHVGIMSREVIDAQIIYETIAGHDVKDPTSLNEKIYSGSSSSDVAQISKLKGFISWKHIEGSVDDDVLVAIKDGVSLLKDAGIEIVEDNIPSLDYAALTSSVIMKSEVGAAHSSAVKNSPDRYSPQLRSLLLAGESNKVEDYLLAMQARRIINQDIHVVNNWHNLHRLSSLLGLPTISMPQSINASGLPTSIQFIFGRKKEKQLFDLSMFYSDINPWIEKPKLEYNENDSIQEALIDKGGQVVPDSNFLHEKALELKQLVKNPFEEPLLKLDEWDI
jgi:aspartyl-tRNA(Asn)/glutamyl-tRNA(Gln) amidotransferase subunit A